MKLRVILVCTLLLLAALPTFAAPPCQDCDYWWNECVYGDWSYERCTYDASGNCYTYPGFCISRTATTVAAEWKVASIEISRPSLSSITVTAPAAVAEIQVRTPETIEKK
ncbi:MAG TPA: hypothetical protein VGF48_14795 [Thermoanaerobaculia bacterium]|jgi:hypothetical protein